jgi:hypothetical protein
MTKYSPLSPTYSSAMGALNEEEREKLKRKQSLKDILKNKREKSAYKP